jgi:putative hydrolase of the HAD superfamily
MRQQLLIDADDTLWENNIYFERATHAFLEFLNHSSLSHDEVRAVLEETERIQGYGTQNFIKSLQKTYTRLAEREVRNEDLEQIRTFGEQIGRHPLELLPGVQETLAYLAPRHELILLTKGNEEEQRLKIENSGLDLYFQHTLVVPEKNVPTYQRLIDELGLDPQISWMIGNSPRSDINPARAAGLNAVFIPHPHTWNLEREEVRSEGSGRLLQLKAFAELREHF